MKPLLWLCFATMVLHGAPALARPQAKLFVIALGVNASPTEASGGLSKQPLSFADDDAAAIADLGASLGATTYLLTAPDRATVQRFPGVHKRVRPATQVELEKVIFEVGVQLDVNKAKGIPSEIIFFYSGHGTQGGEGVPALTLSQGSINHEVLFQRLLPRLPARSVHLIIDACYAEAIVRPRDVSAGVVDLTDAELSEKAVNGTLRQFPSVGALLASTQTTQSHEWDQYQHGVFTYELLSGLRGGADVDGDGRIEYSEIAAFLSAANREVKQQQARLTTVAAPPRENSRTALVDWNGVTAVSYLAGVPQSLGRIVVETAQGRRLADLNTESSFAIKLALPAATELFVRNDEREASFVGTPASVVRLEKLLMTRSPLRPRGAIDSALRRGLFATPFGPAYYSGYVDQTPSLMPVDMAEAPGVAAVATPLQEHETVDGGRWRRATGWLSVAAGTALTAGAGYYGFGALSARDKYLGTSFEKPSAEARDEYNTKLNTSVAFAAGAAVSFAVAYWIFR